MKKKIRFIINPVSGIGKQKRIVEIIKQSFEDAIFESEIRYTEAAGHATVLSAEAAANNYFAVIAVGGDGSVNEIGKGLIGSETALGIIPAGSGNGIANHLKISHDIVSALHTIRKGRIINVDTLTVNGETCIGLAGFGFDAHIAYQFAGYGKRGFSSYIKIVAREILKFKPLRFQFELDGKPFTRDAFLLTLANFSEYGNHASIAPHADMRDGKMEVCILKITSWMKIPGLLFHLFNKSLDRTSALEIHQGSLFKMKNVSGILIHIDGESKKIREDIEVKMNPLSLKFIVP